MSDFSSCDVSNVERCVELLNSELAILDFPELQYNEENLKEVVATLVNTCFSVVGSYRLAVLKVNQSSSEIVRLNNVQEKVILERKTSLTTGENQRKLIDKLKDDIKSLNSLREQLQKDLKQTKAELTKLKTAFDNAKRQFDHALRKKENELKRFQSNGSATGKRVEKTYEHPEKNPTIEEHICSLHNHIQFLVTENAEIKSTLLKVRRRLNKLHGKDISTPQTPDEQLLNAPSSEVLELFDAEFDLLCNNLKYKLKSK